MMEETEPYNQAMKFEVKKIPSGSKKPLLNAGLSYGTTYKKSHGALELSENQNWQALYFHKLSHYLQNQKIDTRPFINVKNTEYIQAYELVCEWFWEGLKVFPNTWKHCFLILESTFFFFFYEH